MHHSHSFTRVKTYGQFFPIAGKFSYFRKRARQNLVPIVTSNSVNIDPQHSEWKNAKSMCKKKKKKKKKKVQTLRGDTAEIRF